ncbi:MAG: NADH-quinone oxidoreductase subunit B [Planctomycetota bacterium]|nr:NADH-quinone oxidoreductase subunit B [Planctomycetota bacterium]
MGILEHRFSDENVICTNVDTLLNLGKEHSLWYLLFATACCGIELMQWGASKYDSDRFGMIPRATPRQADLMIVAGTITLKMASRVRRLYEQMPEPKWVISMGSCANAGGPFCKYSYSVLKGIDKYVPVDVYVPGCPPRPEALIEGVFKLREVIREERVLVKEGKPLPKRAPIVVEDPGAKIFGVHAHAPAGIKHAGAKEPAGAN